MWPPKLVVHLWMCPGRMEHSPRINHRDEPAQQSTLLEMSPDLGSYIPQTVPLKSVGPAASSPGALPEASSPDFKRKAGDTTDQLEDLRWTLGIGGTIRLRVSNRSRFEADLVDSCSMHLTQRLFFAKERLGKRVRTLAIQFLMDVTALTGVFLRTKNTKNMERSDRKNGVGGLNSDHHSTCTGQDSEFSKNQRW